MTSIIIQPTVQMSHNSFSRVPPCLLVEAQYLPRGARVPARMEHDGTAQGSLHTPCCRYGETLEVWGGGLTK